MKVVLFCGGQGLRIRDEAHGVPKPMVTVGYRPILWHVMRTYAHYGHKDFILCLGYRGDVIKRYFLEYNEAVSNDFVLTGAGRQVSMLKTDIEDWRITFVDTGLNANIGQRLKAVEKHLSGEHMFLANYTDGLTDLRLPEMIDRFKHSDAVGSFLAVRPSASFHVVQHEQSGRVQSIGHVGDSGLRINGGYFVFRRTIFEYLQPGDDLVEAPFHRLIAEGKLLAYPYDGFWACMDTFKERQLLEDLYSSGTAPWMVWNGKETGSR
ncbi:MAG TPA: sugar phosphate nucleotidyltransferase [Candidatus Methylomirabilis sp.]|nr:sugar phosphate nucleotidyltransferase [Candidatus Methylomirabilis sp.]